MFRFEVVLRTIAEPLQTIYCYYNISITSCFLIRLFTLEEIEARVSVYHFSALTYALHIVGKKKYCAIRWVTNCQFEVIVWVYWVMFHFEILLNALNCWWTDAWWGENRLNGVPMFRSCKELPFVMVVFLYLYHCFT